MQHSLHADSAYVLHKRPYRESSLLVDFFSFEYGRISVVWRAARNSKHSISSEPFVALQISCSGRNELKTLIGVDTKNQPAAAFLSGRNLYTGLYLNELLFRLLAPYDPHKEIFLGYEQLLQRLRTQQNSEAALRNFELNLLAALGYEIEFDVEAGGDVAVLAGEQYEFIAGEGFQHRLQSHAEGIRGQVLLAIAAGDWQASDVLRTLKMITRSALAFHLQGRPLRSAEYFRPVKLPR